MRTDSASGEQPTAPTTGERGVDDARPGAKVGRFSILTELGAGAMGRIYEAHDPNLDRHVALKLLRGVGATRERDTMVREARALARLDHPNVLTVHDVGVHNGTLFVAMELVRGGSLRDWQERHPIGAPGRFESAMSLLVDAGRGLVAAHAAGLVHCDVKPSNILIGDGGRAKVADFGIARAIEPEGSAPEFLDDKNARPPSSQDADSSTTETEGSSGTPAYMAPEQFGGGSVGPSADQFSFCVTAWELLFGAPPFPKDDLRARLAAIEEGRLEKPDGVDVDPKLEALVRRGLEYRASDRHQCFGDLVDALSRTPTRAARAGRPHARRWVLAAVASGALASVAAYRLGQPEGQCAEQAASALAEVWNDERRNSTRAAMLGSGLEFAPGSWSRLERGLDDYTRTWRDEHTESCEASRLRAEQSLERMEAQHACLDGGKRYISALLELVSTGSPSALANTEGLLAGLPSVGPCKDARASPGTEESATLDAVAHASALRHAGRPAEALERIAPLASTVGEEASSVVTAYVLLEYGRALLGASNARWAIEPLSEAYALAQSDGLTTVGAVAARELSRVYARNLGDAELGRRWLLLASPTGHSLSLRDRYDQLTLESSLLSLEGKHDEAFEVLTRSVELATEDPGLLPFARLNLARELEKRRSLDRAVAQGRQALRERQDWSQAEHPSLGIFESALAGVLADVALGGPHATAGDEAEALARKALERSRQTWGDGHLSTAPYLIRLSSIQCSLRRDVPEGLQLASDALQLYAEDAVSSSRRDALEAFARCALQDEAQFAKEAWDLVFLSKEMFGEKHQRTVLARTRYVQALLRAPHPQNEQLWNEMLLVSALAKEQPTDADPYVAARIHGALGEVAGRVGKGSMGVEHTQAAVDLLEGRESPLEAHARRALCYAQWKADLRERALAECRTALEVALRDPEPRTLGLIHHTLGVLLWKLGRSEEALEHMKPALALFAQVGRETSALAKTHWVLGELHERLEQHLEAQEHYRESFELFGDPYPTERMTAGAGQARMTARLGDFDGAQALLERLSEQSDDSIPLEQAPLWETRGYIKHLHNRRKGRPEYIKALDLFVVTGKTNQIERICSVSPFKLAECERLGYRNETE